MLFSSAACSKRRGSRSSKNVTECMLEIVYKKGQMCYAIDPDTEELNLFVFSAAGQPVYDAKEQASSGSILLPGMVVSVEYDGYILETYPSQFSGISKISIRDTKANNVDFLVSQISGMFPSTKPSGALDWEIAFSGDTPLSPGEKRALEYILKENWAGASVTVEPQQDEPDVGRILIDFQNVKTDSMDILITVNDGLNAEMVKELHPVLKDGIWTLG